MPSEQPHAVGLDSFIKPQGRLVGYSSAVPFQCLSCDLNEIIEGILFRFMGDPDLGGVAKAMNTDLQFKLISKGRSNDLKAPGKNITWI